MIPKNNDKKTGVCDVHKLTFNDTTEREVTYCEICNAWICDDCEKNYSARAKAATLVAIEKIKNSFILKR